MKQAIWISHVGRAVKFCLQALCHADRGSRFTAHRLQAQIKHSTRPFKSPNDWIPACFVTISGVYSDFYIVSNFGKEKSL